LPRNLKLKNSGKGRLETFRLQSLLNEIAPILVISVLASEDRGRGLTAAMIHESIKGLFFSEGEVTFPPSFLYPLMKSLTQAKLIKREGSRYSILEKARSLVAAEQKRLIVALVRAIEYLKAAQGKVEGR